MTNERDRLPDLTNHVDDKRIDIFINSFCKWVDLPRGIDYHEGSLERTRVEWLCKRSSSEAVETFILEKNKRRDDLVMAGKYEEAVNSLRISFSEAPNYFKGDELLLAQVHILRSLGGIFITKLEKNAKPNSEPNLNEHYSDVINAGLCNMKLDELVGCITPMGINNMFLLTLTPGLEVLHEDAEIILFGGKPKNLTIINCHDLAGMAVIKDLRRRVSKRGFHPGESESAFFVLPSDVPDSKTN
jgi:hypothetical protein